ncbi:hypothetical protein ABPG72_006245 [Tetrahymena utriculariae]
MIYYSYYRVDISLNSFSSRHATAGQVLAEHVGVEELGGSLGVKDGDDGVHALGVRGGELISGISRLDVVLEGLAFSGGSIEGSITVQSVELVGGGVTSIESSVVVLDVITDGGLGGDTSLPGVEVNGGSFNVLLVQDEDGTEGEESQNGESNDQRKLIWKFKEDDDI